MATTDRGYVEQQEFQEYMNALLHAIAAMIDALAIQMHDLRVQTERIVARSLAKSS